MEYDPDAIKRLRRQRGFTVVELAALSGLTVRGLQFIQAKRATPNARTLANLATALGVEASAFFKKRSRACNADSAPSRGKTASGSLPRKPRATGAA
jgi:transcriptional regulator with XRE-family HTH domain